MKSPKKKEHGGIAMNKISSIEIQKEIMENKAKKGFNISSVDREICLLRKNLGKTQKAITEWQHLINRCHRYVTVKGEKPRKINIVHCLLIKVFRISGALTHISPDFGYQEAEN